LRCTQEKFLRWFELTMALTLAPAHPFSFLALHEPVVESTKNVVRQIETANQRPQNASLQVPAFMVGQWE
jgi:hypothetical protein